MYPYVSKKNNPKVQKPHSQHKAKKKNFFLKTQNYDRCSPNKDHDETDLSQPV